MMKRFSLLSLMIISFSACNQNPVKSEAVQNKINNPDILCFERYSGLKNQDTASIYMVINEGRVTGSYSNFLYEKDSRKGTIVGSKAGETITGMWTYMQEGIMDSIRFEFKLEEDALMQKKTSFDRESGRESLTDTASFSLRYVKINCDSRNPG